MSDIATAWLRRNVFGIGQGAKFLLLTLANYADANNECFPGVELLAYELECDVRTVKRHLKKLRELGLLEVSERYRACDDPACGQKNRHAHRTSNYYRLILKRVDLRPGSAAERDQAGTMGDKLSPMGESLMSDKLSPVGESLENQGCSDGGHFVTHGPIGDTAVQPLVTPVSPILNRNEQPDKESPDLTEPELITDQDVSSASQGRVRSRVSSTSREVVSLGKDELTALSECVPAALQAMDAVSAKSVAGLLLERLNAGWKPWEIRQILDRPLPPDVAHLGGLVAYRVRTNVDVEAAPAVLEARLKAARVERESWLLAQNEEDSIPEPEWVAFMEEIQERFPGLSEAEKTRMWLVHSRGKQGMAHV